MPRRPPQVALVTGATGFLGAHVAAKLRERGVPRVLCLVRADDDASARARLAANFARLELDAPDFEHGGLEIVRGDLEADGLALEPKQRAQLAAELDLVVHAGARVDFARDYDALRAANVGGTRALVERCCEAGGAPLHLVSSIGVPAAPGIAPDDVVLEDEDLARFATLEGGYERSKWVAEQLVRNASSRGLPAAIWRVGRLAGDSSTGAWSADDFAARSLRGVVALGLAPGESFEVEMTAVDAVADAIAAVALAEVADGRTFHLVRAEPARFEGLVERLRAAGRPVATTTYRRWYERAREAVRADREHPLAPILALLDEPAEDGPDDGRFAPDQDLPRLDDTNARAALARAGVALPPVDTEAVVRAVAAFERRGLVPKETS
ncbi:MAG: thioester reductase domain-containing protein [Planctomycetota bacterium]